MSLINLLKRGIQDLTDSRVERINRSAKNAYETKITSLQSRIDKIDDDIEDMEDLSTDKESSKSFSGEDFINKLFVMQKEKTLLEAELNVYEEKIGNKYFSDGE